MRDALKSYFALASGLTEVTRQRAVGAAKALVSQGEATAEQVSTLAEDLLVQSKSNREAVTALVRYEVDRTLGRLGLAANDEVTELTKRVRALEAQVRDLQGTTPSGSSKSAAPGANPPKPAAKKATVSKAAGNRTAGKKAAVTKAAATPPVRQPAATSAPTTKVDS
ncbi:MAG: hypothetical protein NVS3B26_11190 [Mycobacteriales bacterium]